MKGLSSALLLVVLCGGTAVADTLDSTRGEPLREVAHTVTARVDGGVATYTVRRTFANPGKQHDEAFVEISLPPGAAATGLRIRAEEKWHDGELMEAEKAAQLYQELTGIGPHKPKDPALLAWESADRLNLRLFPVPPAGIATVEYTLTVPTHYADGRYLLSYPRASDAPNLADPIFSWDGEGDFEVDGTPAFSGMPPAKRLDPIALGLVRPVRIDDVGWTGLADLDLPNVLAEGDSVRFMDTLQSAPRGVEARGMIWAKPWSTKARSSGAFVRASKGFVFSHDLYGSLSHDDMLALAMSAGAVSPVTSYLAIEPGVRPSRAGFGHGEARLGGRGSGGAALRMSASMRVPDFAGLVKPLIESCRDQHSGMPNVQPTQLTVHLTLREVVDIEPLRSPDDYQSCVVSRIWDFALPSGYWPKNDTHFIQI